MTAAHKKSKTPIQLSDHFSYRRLLRFVFPSIVMMIFTSIYGVVDGFFVSNFVGKTPFAALNLIMPVSFQIDGVWISMVIAEILSFIVSMIFLFANKEKYHYI